MLQTRGLFQANHGSFNYTLLYLGIWYLCSFDPKNKETRNRKIYLLFIVWVTDLLTKTMPHNTQSSIETTIRKVCQLKINGMVIHTNNDHSSEYKPSVVENEAQPTRGKTAVAQNAPWAGWPLNNVLISTKNFVVVLVEVGKVGRPYQLRCVGNDRL